MKNGSQTGQQTGQLARTCYSPQKLSDEEGLFVVLSAVTVKQAKPKEKKYVLKDEKGLYLEISPAGGKWWRLRYWMNKKENRISLGVYPETSLAEARIRRDEARLKISKGIDPALERKNDTLKISPAIGQKSFLLHGRKAMRN